MATYTGKHLCQGLCFIKVAGLRCAKFFITPIIREHLRWLLWFMFLTEAATRSVLCRKVFLEIWQNSQENNCARASFLIRLQTWGLQLYQKQTLVLVFSCEFCEISKNTFFTEQFWATASEKRKTVLFALNNL